MLALPGVDVPPRVQELVVDEEEEASEDMAEKGGEDAKEEELRVCCEVGVLQEPEAPVLKWVDQGGGHGPGEEDVESSQNHRPADFGASVNLVLNLAKSHGHGDPGVGQDVEEPLAFGQVPESGLVL